MRKILYILAFVGITTISCEPLEDTYNELDALPKEVSFTMTDGDYEDIANDYVANNKGFDNLDQVEVLLPALLADKYPMLSKGSKAEVNYNYFKGFPAAVISFDESYEVTDEDYDAQGGSVANFGNFSNFGQIVAFLNTRYDPSPADGFLLELEYKYFDGGVSDRTGYFKYDAGTWTEESFELNERYTVQEADYDAQGGSVANFDNFSNLDQINTFLNSKFTNAVKNTVVKLTYDFFDGGVNELTKVFQFDGIETWTLKTGELLTAADYTAMEESFPNFSDKEEAEYKLPIYLKNVFDQFAEEGAEYEFIYEVFNSSLPGSNRTEYTYVFMSFDGEEWALSSDRISSSSNFIFDGETWKLDKAINYVFTSEDYDLVVAEFTGVPDFENQVSNLDNFGNFNRRENDNSEWSDDQLLAAISTVLLNNFPNTEIGTKYDVEVNTYNGSPGKEVVKIILNEDGNYILIEEN